MDETEIVANFVAITGSDDSKAEQMLTATNYDLQAAIDLFFAAGDLETHTAVPAQQTHTAPHNDFEDDEALARRLQSEGAPQDTTSQQDHDDSVRAPIPSRTDRLYGDYYQDPSRRRRRENPAPQNVVDAFRDFRSEASGSGTAPQTSAMAATTTTTGRDHRSGGGGTRLASLFEPPMNLIYNGDFEEAKEHAVKEGRWLILNMQSTSQFACHQLNRDTWSNPSISALVESSFVLFQTYDITDLGQKLLSFYNIYEIPAIVVIDPITGAPMRQWNGFISPEKLIDSLMPFLDTSFTDPGAARLATLSKRKQAMPSTVVGDKSVPHVPGSIEDEELQKALQMSIQEQQPTTQHMTNTNEIESENNSRINNTIDEEDSIKKKSAQDVAAEALARLPEEPTGEHSCRIALRFPHGSRVQRRFLRTAPLRAVHDWCLSQSEEAAHGRSFYISEAMPGAAALNDLDMSLEEAKVADAMLVMKWND